MSSRVVSASFSYPSNKVSKATVRYNFSDGCEMYLDLNISIALYALPQRLGMSNVVSSRLYKMHQCGNNLRTYSSVYMDLRILGILRILEEESQDSSLIQKYVYRMENMAG